MVSGLRNFTERSTSGSKGPVLDVVNGEELMHVQPGVAVVLGNRSIESPGTLYITTKQVVWLSDVDMQKGYAVDFLSVSLHAISKDPQTYPVPCIYTQIEIEDDDEEESESSDSDCVTIEDISKITEMRLIPSDPSQLENLFEIFCECAELNPEPDEDDEEEEHNWIFSADQLEGQTIGVEEPKWFIPEDSTNSIGFSNGDHNLSGAVLKLHINDQRFDDPEEIEQVCNTGLK